MLISQILGRSWGLLTNYRTHILSASLTILAICMTNSSAMAQTWQTEIVSIGTSLEDRGSYTSLAFDAFGNQAISYYDATNGDLRYAHHIGSTWEDTIVDSTGDVGAYSSLAFDASGSPGIAYYWNDGGIGKLKYAHFNGATWDITTVDAATLVNYFMGRYCSLAFDASDRPAISYSGYYSGGYGQGTYLRYARFNGTSWNKTEVTSNCAGTSLAFDASGNPGIAYVTNPATPTYYPLRYAHFNGTSWSISYVIPHTASRTTLYYPSLAFSPLTGNPAIAYGGLYFASFDTAWNITAVGSGGGHNSLAFDNAGNPAISYYNSTNADLMYAHFNGISWDTTTIDSAGSVGLYTSLAFDNVGNPAISYYEATSYHKCLKFAHIEPPAMTCVAPHDINLSGYCATLGGTVEDNPVTPLDALIILGLAVGSITPDMLSPALTPAAAAIIGDGDGDVILAPVDALIALGVAVGSVPPQPPNPRCVSSSDIGSCP